MWWSLYFVFTNWSSPLQDFWCKTFNRNFVVQTGCCEDCASGCSADVESVVDNFVGQINKHPRISPFVKAEKLVSCWSPTADTVDYESYTLTIADEGGIQELAAIQATYPNATILVLEEQVFYLLTH